MGRCGFGNRQSHIMCLINRNQHNQIMGGHFVYRPLEYNDINGISYFYSRNILLSTLRFAPLDKEMFISVQSDFHLTHYLTG